MPSDSSTMSFDSKVWTQISFFVPSRIKTRRPFWSSRLCNLRLGDFREGRRDMSLTSKRSAWSHTNQRSPMKRRWQNEARCPRKHFQMSKLKTLFNEAGLLIYLTIFDCHSQCELYKSKLLNPNFWFKRAKFGKVSSESLQSLYLFWNFQIGLFQRGQ